MTGLLTSVQAFRARCRDKFLSYARAPHAKWWLAAFSFLEASIFPIAPDILLIALVVVKPFRWFFYAFITTAASAFGGIAGYLVGFLFFKAFGADIVAFYGLEEEMGYIMRLFEENAFWAVFSAAFTPIPYKAFTLSAGFFSISFVPFLVASIAGRGLRFFAVSYVVKYFGERFSVHIIKFFDIFTLLIVAVLVLIFLFLGIYR